MAFVYQFGNFAPYTPEQKKAARKTLLERFKKGYAPVSVGIAKSVAERQAEKQMLKAQQQAAKQAQQLLKAQKKAEKEAQKAAKKAEKAAQKAYQKSIKQALKVLPPSPEPYIAPGEVKPIYEIVQPGKKVKKVAKPQVQYIYPQATESISALTMEPAIQPMVEPEFVPTPFMAGIPTWGWIAIAGAAVFFLFGGKGIKGKGGKRKNVY